MTTESACWFTSSYSSNGGACIEVAVPVTAFAAFVAGVQGGTFDAV
ncbi:DUF397 domain-containing protein [Streptomyces anulatus]